MKNMNIYIGVIYTQFWLKEKICYRLMEKVYFRSQILEHSSIGKYWNMSDHVVFPLRPYGAQLGMLLIPNALC